MATVSGTQYDRCSGSTSLTTPAAPMQAISRSVKIQLTRPAAGARPAAGQAWYHCLDNARAASAMESRSVSMARPGVVSVYCNMHPEMVGYILVVPNALYARAGQDGFFRLTNVPAGHHRIVAWAPNTKPVTVEADVVEAEAATVELEIKLGRQLPHTNKDGMPYGSYKE